MDSKSLMIGDWVYDTILKCNTQVEILSLSGIRADCNDSIWNEKTFEPIPLTAEILEKNGWKYNDMPFVQGWEQYGILLYVGGNGYRINCGTNIALIIDSVHELQHALRLCGIDKEIVL